LEEIGVVLSLLSAVVVSSAFARATRLALPLVQISLGAIMALSPLHTVRLDPEIFFILFLPPLLFLDGWRIPKRELVRHRIIIVELALGLVVLTVAGLGLFIHWLIPAMPLPVAFALAAIVSPTDPIAVSAVTKRTPIPRRVMYILEGESLLNDASGLVCMRFAVAAMLTGSFSLPGAVVSFLWVASGGLVIGVGVTWGITTLRRWASARVGEDTGTEILVSLLIPFGTYLIAEQLHCSGILAVVAAGVTMSLTENQESRAVTRVRRTAVWDTVRLAASGAIFVLLGEQIPEILSGAYETVQQAGHQGPWWLALYVLAIVSILALLRFAWVWTSLRLTWFRSRGIGEIRSKPGRKLVLLMSLAGVRGTVTLAGILTLPLALTDGSPFPARGLAIFLAAGVILVWLFTATLFLPPLLKRLDLPPEPIDEAAEDRLRRAAAEAAIQAIEAAQHSLAVGRANADVYADAAARLMEMYRLRIEASPDEAESTPLARQIESIERQLHIAGLRAERRAIFQAGRSGAIDEVTMGKMVREVDLQEARYGS
jgi:CPA1 family monovalent cation:H+ antiporter